MVNMKTSQSTSVLNTLTKQVGVFIFTFVICISGFFLKGEWLVLLTVFEHKHTDNQKFLLMEYSTWKDILNHVAWSVIPTLFVYLVICAILEWYYYYLKRDRAEEWKCQPRKFLSWEDEKNEIFLGIFSLTIASALSGVASWHISCGGRTTLYFDISDHGWTYFILSIPAHFLFSEFTMYWAHRTFHTPWLYRRIHKYHHRYKQPTPFSFSAMHPIEMVTYQTVIFAPMFLVPIHYVELLMQLTYFAYYGIMDHSGIKMEAAWPWQPNTTFHDNHHQYFHCNFGSNTSWHDRLFGTMRNKKRIYNENTFYGTGKELHEATQQEIEQHEYNIKDD